MQADEFIQRPAGQFLHHGIRSCYYPFRRTQQEPVYGQLYRFPVALLAFSEIFLRQLAFRDILEETVDLAPHRVRLAARVDGAGIAFGGYYLQLQVEILPGLYGAAYRLLYKRA